MCHIRRRGEQKITKQINVTTLQMNFEGENGRKEQRQRQRDNKTKQQQQRKKHHVHTL